MKKLHYIHLKKNQAIFLSNTFNDFTLSSGKISHSFCFSSLEVAIESAETDVRPSLVSLLIDVVFLHKDNYMKRELSLHRDNYKLSQFVSLMSASSVSP